MHKNLTVLLVEDDDPLRRVLAELLQQWGCTVFPTEHARQALELVRRQSIDFSILDQHLPDMTGVEIFRTIRTEFGVNLPAILISGDATPEEARQALELGMFHFLKKPLDMNSLRQCLDMLTRQHFGRGLAQRPRP
ncbi:MAG: response regulator [Planctomycetes bacterium]|nr:response regulator [Planctomycetota bacterium]